MAIKISNLTYSYNDNMIKPYKVLSDLNLTINEGDIVAIAGETGAGKSTFAEIIAGFSNPTMGNVLIDDVDIYANKNKNDKILAKEARKKVGMVFQYSDYQLFEETVEKDIAFAPKEMGFPEKTIKEKVKRSIDLVGLPENIKNRVPYNLSGGEKKLVAIAGILAFSPKYLILDEPTIGLDSFYKDKIIKLILHLNKEENTTIIFISHSMEIISEIANKTILMKYGKILKYDITKNIFSDNNLLQEAGLKPPKISQFLNKLNSEGFNVKDDVIKFDDGIKNIIEAIK